MATKYEIRYSAHYEDVKKYDTAQLRTHFLVESIMQQDEINLVYSHYDRFIAGGVVPVTSKVELESIPPLKAEYFLQRRELGIYNVGGKGKVSVDGIIYDLNFKEALYIAICMKKIS